ncbi:hypothetical protein [Pantoea septica]|uniref:hypothetical protein n=1 Tax=Pantoea septica TaxID=472695 RepID=UPI0028992FF7|nr:hypothetical protein [Pantoea septica]
MPEYHFYQKGKDIVALECSKENQALKLINQGYEKQFEEVNASTEKSALTRLFNIRTDNRIDQRSFLAGAGTMPLIGILTAVAFFLLRKNSPDIN